MDTVKTEYYLNTPSVLGMVKTYHSIKSVLDLEYRLRDGVGK